MTRAACFDGFILSMKVQVSASVSVSTTPPSSLRHTVARALRSWIVDSKTEPHPFGMHCSRVPNIDLSVVEDPLLSLLLVVSTKAMSSSRSVRVCGEAYLVAKIGVSPADLVSSCPSYNGSALPFLFSLVIAPRPRLAPIFQQKTGERARHALCTPVMEKASSPNGSGWMIYPDERRKWKKAAVEKIKQLLLLFACIHIGKPHISEDPTIVITSKTTFGYTATMLN
jgi:hypothetical protein